MGMFDWDSRYDIGVDAMNREHRILLDLMARLQALCDERAAKPTVVALLDKLAAYTVQHFRDEEAYMESIQYADRKLHGVIHKQLLDKLEGHRVAFVSGPSATLSPDFFHFLKGWLSAHIIGIDMKYGAVAKQKKSA